MKTFEERKKHALWKMEELDRSKKGSVDTHVKPMLEAINVLDDYYTTSSCAGRILLLHEPESKKKNQYAWPYVTHELADAAPFLESLTELEGKPGTVWMRMQTVIVHVACRDVEAANALLKQFYAHGWKRSGIFSLDNDVMLELLSVEGMDTIVMQNGKRLVNEEYIHTFIEQANEKLQTAHDKILQGAQRIRTLARST